MDLNVRQEGFLRADSAAANAPPGRPPVRVDDRFGTAFVGMPEQSSLNADKMVPGGFLNGFEALIEELGGDPAQLLAEVGIDPRALARKHAKVPVLAVGELLENAAYILGCADLGMRLAKRQNGPRMMKPLDRLICTAPTLEEVWRCCELHMQAYSSGIRVTLGPDPENGLQLWRTEISLENCPTLPQLIEHLQLLAHDGALYLSEGRVRARRVTFSHLPISGRWVYARHFGTTVEFGEEFDQLAFTEASIRTKIPSWDSQVFEYESGIISDLFPPQEPSVVDNVRDAVKYTLGRFMCTRREVSQMLGIGARTLHRRLQAVGSSFEDIRDDVRRDLALRYLSRTDLSLIQIAGRLGYSEHAVLSRSCRRWFGLTPSEMRRHLMRTRGAKWPQ